MKLIKLTLSSILIMLICEASYSQTSKDVGTAVYFNNFIVKANHFNNQLEVIAADGADNPIENLNGTFIFSINGFEQELKFNNGTA